MPVITYRIKIIAAVFVVAALVLCSLVSAPVSNAEGAHASRAKAAHNYAAKPAKAKLSTVKSSAPGKVTVKVKKAKRAKKYQYQIALDGGFFAKVKSKTTTSKSWTATGLSPDVRYWARCRGISGKKKGKWSKARSVVCSMKVPYDVKIDTDYGIVTAKPVYAIRYRIQSSSNKSFTKDVKTYTASIPYRYVSLPDPGGTRWYRIRAEGTLTVSAWSVIRKVTMPNVQQATYELLGEGESAVSPVTGYSYEFHVINEGNLYTDVPIIVYVKTDNPYVDFFELMGTGGSWSEKQEYYADVLYTDPNKSYRVEGGFLFAGTYSTTGKKTVVLKETSNPLLGASSYKDTGISFEVNVARDSNTELMQWFETAAREAIAKHPTWYSDLPTRAGMLTALKDVVNGMFYYRYDGYKADGTYGQGIKPMSEDIYRYWMKGPDGEYYTEAGNCGDLVGVMKKVARALGVPESDIVQYGSGAAHENVMITIDGVTLDFKGLAGSKTSPDGTACCPLDCRPGHVDYIDLSEY